MRPPEAPAIAAERARLTALAAGLDGAIKSTELTWVRARQLIEKITVLRHSLFTKNLMERLPSPLLPGLWRDLDERDARPSATASAIWPRTGCTGPTSSGSSSRCCSLPRSSFFVLSSTAIARLTDRRRVRTEAPLPSFFERARSVAWVAPLRALPADRRRRARSMAGSTRWTCSTRPGGAPRRPS